MIRIITMIVLATFFPMQLFAVDLGGFGSDTQIEYFVPRGPEAPTTEWNDPRLTDKITGESPKNQDSGTNWWMWGGLTVLVVGVIAAVAGGGSGGGGGGDGGGSATTSVTGTW